MVLFVIVSVAFLILLVILINKKAGEDKDRFANALFINLSQNKGWPRRYDSVTKTIEGNKLYLDLKDGNAVLVRSQSVNSVRCYLLTKDNVVDVFDKQVGVPDKESDGVKKHIVIKTSINEQHLISYSFFETESSPAYVEVEKIKKTVNSSGAGVDQDNCEIDVVATDDFYPEKSESNKRFYYYLGIPVSAAIVFLIGYEFAYNPRINDSQDLYNVMRSDEAFYCGAAKRTALGELGGVSLDEVERRYQKRLLNHDMSRPLDTFRLHSSAHESVRRDAIRNASCSVSFKGDEAVVQVSNISRTGSSTSGSSVFLFYSGEYSELRKQDAEVYEVLYKPDMVVIE